MEWYARFLKDVKNNKVGLNFLRDDGSNDTRYFVCSEDKDKYYIIRKSNTIKTSGHCAFDKKYENKLFELYLEAN